MRAADSEYDDSTLLRHRRELREELDEEDKPRARSKVPSAITIFWKGKNLAGFFILTKKTFSQAWEVVI